VVLNQNIVFCVAINIVSNIDMTTFKTLEDTVDNFVEATNKLIESLKEQNRKQKEALDYVKMWLNENIDEGSKNSIEQDSANLLQHVKEHLGE
jgi:oligoribonuclease (3'-5' exoribonuclease)